MKKLPCYWCSQIHKYHTHIPATCKHYDYLFNYLIVWKGISLNKTIEQLDQKGPDILEKLVKEIKNESSRE